MVVMDPTVAGALIGGGSAVAGVTITLVAGALQERVRRSHELARSDADRAERLALTTHESKEQLYGTFVSTANVAGALAWDALLNVNPVHVDPERGAAYQECTRLLTAFKLVAPAAVIVAASDWWEALTASTSWAAAIGPRTDRAHPADDQLYDEHWELVARLRACERAFLDAARSDLGVRDPLPEGFGSSDEATGQRS